MSELGQAASFAMQLYRWRATVAIAGHVRRDRMALLTLRPGRVDPYAIYERMRAEGTLTPTRLGNWATTSHHVCNTVLRDRRFGVRPVDDATAHGPALVHGQPSPSGPVAAQGHAVDGGAAASDEPAVAAQEQMDLSFLEMNPPDHTRLRRLAMPAFSPKAVATYRERIVRTVGDLLDRAATAGEFDLVSAFAAPLPIAVITDLLGIPGAEQEDFARHGMLIGGALDGIKSLRHAAALKASDARLQTMFERLFELRRHEPGDDIVSHVVAAEGDQIQPAEMLPMCVLLLVAGFETTVNLIGNGVLALLDHPEQWEALCADPEAMAPRAVEETLRYDPPVQRTGRVALETTELEGKPVRRGQFVVTLIGGANRDPEVYERPNTFDINRVGAADHLAFSSGIHYCIGQPLATLEARIAFQMLAERMPQLRRSGRVRRRNATTIRGPLHMPVVVGRTSERRSSGARSDFTPAAG